MTSLVDIDFLIERLGGEQEEPLYKETDTDLAAKACIRGRIRRQWRKTKLPQHLLDCYAVCFPEEAAQYSYPGATLHDAHAQLEDETSASDGEEQAEGYNYVKVARYRRKALSKRRLHYQKKPILLDYRRFDKNKFKEWRYPRKTEMRDLFDYKRGADEWWRAYDDLMRDLTTHEQPRRVRLHQRPLDKDDFSRLFQPAFSVLTHHTQHALDISSGALPPQMEENDGLKGEEKCLEGEEEGNLGPKEVENDEGKPVPNLLDY
ncbi:hypothetical protein BCR43DRAFT_485198 [Syncephalastrum racemosum]|uniref:Uncharacterized protein n=1 Tax=Syncephalastrum racemosum TaxID=13706 RepID=A0A1X2HMB7_SYNRA|nr:hypothetical protein BCR43DRAFT_485198 [Syncephalastrum racemosum]